MPKLPRGLSGPSNGRSEQDLVNSGLNPEIPLFKRGLGGACFTALYYRESAENALCRAVEVNKA